MFFNLLFIYMKEVALVLLLEDFYVDVTIIPNFPFLTFNNNKIHVPYFFFFKFCFKPIFSKKVTFFAWCIRNELFLFTSIFHPIFLFEDWYSVFQKILQFLTFDIVQIKVLPNQVPMLKRIWHTKKNIQAVLLKW